MGISNLLAMTHEQIEVLKSYVSTNLNTEITLDKMSELTGIHKTKLCKEFKILCGITPMRYVMAERITRAKELLGGNMKVAEIALECGFSSQAHFSMAFKKEVGTPPLRWRKAAAATEPISCNISPL